MIRIKLYQFLINIYKRYIIIYIVNGTQFIARNNINGPILHT